MTHRPLKFFLTNAVTACGMLGGVVSISLAAQGLIRPAAWFLLFCCLTDGLDGVLARKLKTQSRFGKVFDSVSDFFAFGIGPAAILWYNDGGNALTLGICLAYVLACGGRLLRFHKSADIHFSGLPSTASAGFVALLILSGSFRSSSHALFPWVWAALAWLMVSKIRFKRPRW
jgi:CDP-diacylglycerol--serine O-phosphatidyltransferase